MKRHVPLKRTGRLKARGRSRFPHRRDRAYTDWIRGLPCLLGYRVARDVNGEPHICYGPVQVCHVKSRGAGGDDQANVIPMCLGAHDQQGTMGIQSFQRWWGIDLATEAQRLYQLYLRETT